MPRHIAVNCIAFAASVCLWFTDKVLDFLGIHEI